MKHTILIVEDEPSLLLSLQDNLCFEGYEVLTATNGEEGLGLALTHKPDLVLLDVMLPGRDGFSVCKAIKETHPDLPVMILSARDQTIDVVRGLEWGADDYLKKPFEMAECLARVKVRLRQHVATSPTHEQAQIGALSLDFKRMEATKDGQALSLTAREFRLLELFVSRRGQVLSRETILNEVWGYEVFPTTRTVDNYILRLRKVLEEDPTSPTWLLSVRGVGYRLAD